MKYVVIVDSMSNMPSDALKNRNNVTVMPMNIAIHGKPNLDLLDHEQLIEFYKKNPVKEDSKADATSPTADQMSVFILNEIAPNYDCAIFLSTSAIFSDVFKSIEECAKSIENEARVLRKMAGISEPFKLLICNTGNSSSGQSLVALYADTILDRGCDPETALENIERFKKCVKTYSVISDILHARSRMNMIGQKTISMPSAVSGQLQRNAPIVRMCNDVFHIEHLKISYKQSIKSLFAYAESCLESGLYIPIVLVSYAGKIQELRLMAEFKSFEYKARKKGVTVLTGMMSVAACINYSTGSLSLGIAPKDASLMPVL